MLNCIYDVFLTCDKNNCPDLVVMALPMFVADAMNNTREYVADETDIAMWHEEFAKVSAQEDALKEIREFIGRHYDALVEAFMNRDRAAFDVVVEKCIAADIAAEKEAAEEAANGET